MDPIIRSHCLGSEDGLHQKGQMGFRWLQKCQPQGFDFCWSGVQRECQDSIDLCCLNGLDVCAADVQNACLQAPSSQKDCIMCGPEFGSENIGKRALIKRALHGGKAAGRDFRNHQKDCTTHLEFEPCLADPDVWMRPAIKADGTECYKCVLLHVDDALCISQKC